MRVKPQKHADIKGLDGSNPTLSASESGGCDILCKSAKNQRIAASFSTRKGTPAGSWHGDNKSAFRIRTHVTHNGGVQVGLNREKMQALFLPHFAANQLAGIIVILDDVDVTALLRVTLDDCDLAVPEFLDGFGLAIKIVIVDLADENPVRVFLDEINLSVKIPIAFNFDKLIVFVGFDDVWPSVTVCIDGDLVVVLIDTIYPLIGEPVATTVRNCAGGFPAAGNEAESQRC